MHAAPEPTFTPTPAAWQAHERAAREPGEALDPAAAVQARSALGFDFSRVRVHRGPSADQAADAMAARAYTFGDQIFLRHGEAATGTGVLAHELGHVVEQAGQAPTVMRAPAAAPPPATYIIVYGTGRVNPQTPVDHNVGLLFKKAADAKRREITARLGKTAAQNTIVFEYTPTENELKAVLNKKYALPVKEIHIFSHGWDEGVNLGGPDPGPGKKGVDDKPQERRLIAEDLGEYKVQWAGEPTVVLYGCNTGNPAGNPAFAQTVADEFGVPVKGPTTSSHFEFGGTWGVQQVPDKPGKVVEYKPTPTAINGHLAEADRLVKAMAVTRTVKNGFLNVFKADQEFAEMRITFDRHVQWLTRVLADTRITIADRDAKKAKLAAHVKRVKQLSTAKPGG